MYLTIKPGRLWSQRQHAKPAGLMWDAVACFLSGSPKANSLKCKDGLHGGWQNKCLLHPAELRPWRHFSQKLSCSSQLFGKTLPRWRLPLSPTSTHMVMTTSRTKTGSPHGSRPWLDHSLYQNKSFQISKKNSFKPKVFPVHGLTQGQELFQGIAFPVLGINPRPRML